MQIFLLALAVATISVAAAAADQKCRPSDVPSILAQVRQAEDRGEFLGRYGTPERCFAAWGERLRRRRTDAGQHLACVTRQTVTGSVHIDLKALDFNAADALCLRINVCLFDLFDRGDNDPANRSLAQAWDRLSCMGH